MVPTIELVELSLLATLLASGGMGVVHADWRPLVFLFILPLLILFAVLVVWRTRDRAWLLTLMPLGWLLLVLCGVFFYSPSPNETGRLAASGIGAVAALAGVATVVFMKGARIFAALYVTIAAYFVFGAYLVATLAADGSLWR